MAREVRKSKAYALLQNHPRNERHGYRPFSPRKILLLISVHTSFALSISLSLSVQAEARVGQAFMTK